MDDARYRWIALHIFPCEPEIRRWLRRHVHTLPAADIDDILQEAYAKIWDTDFARIGNARGYFYTVVRNQLLEQARRARIVGSKLMARSETGDLSVYVIDNARLLSMSFIKEQRGPQILFENERSQSWESTKTTISPAGTE